MHLTGAKSVAVDELAVAVRARFGPRLRELALFGSHARGEANEESDVDLLIVVDELTGDEARQVAWLCGDLLTKHDVILSPFVLSTARMALLRTRERAIALEIERDRVSL